MIFKKKLRNVTAKEYKAWRNEQCMGGACGNCLFHSVCCSTSKNSWVNNKHVYSDWFLDQEIEIEVDNPKLTENEKVILRNVDKKWKYIARNINGKLCLFTEKPTKKNEYWFAFAPGSDCFFFSIFNHLFSTITWEDEEPYLIEYLLARK